MPSREWIAYVKARRYGKVGHIRVTIVSIRESGLENMEMESEIQLLGDSWVSPKAIGFDRGTGKLADSFKRCRV